MNLVSVVFTVYALFGDDVRLLATAKSADMTFNCLAVLCLCYFSTEITLKCLSQKDYFLGFFFVLDTVATASLLLDLTWVSDVLSEESVGDSGSKARSSRTARVGASLGRVVRVLRLVRILKLYKAYWEAKQKTKKKKAAEAAAAPGGSGKAAPGAEKAKALQEKGFTSEDGRLGRGSGLLADDDWEAKAINNGEEEDEAGEGTESAVGKKLVALTTRKVILLVLLMLLVMPFLAAQSVDMFKSSADWGADRIWESWRTKVNGNGTAEEYERAVLKFFYVHNWFDGQRGSCEHGQECSASYYAQVFWIGVAGRDASVVQMEAAKAQLRPEAVADWERYVQGPGLTNYYSMGSFPSQAQEVLSSPWDQACKYSDSAHFGISILSRTVPGILDSPIRCPDDVRPQEKYHVSPSLMTQSQFDDFHIAIYFDLRRYIKQGALCGILTTIFVCIVLSVAAVAFSADANTLVLAPIERMITKVNIIRFDPQEAIKMADSAFQVEEAKKEHLQRRETRRRSIANAKTNRDRMWKILVEVKELLTRLMGGHEQETVAETAILEKTIIKLGTLLALGFGQAGIRIVSGNMHNLDSAGINALTPGTMVDCIIGCVRIRNFSLATEVLQKGVMTFVNQIAEIVHGLVNECHGAVNTNNGETFLIIWKMEVDSTDADETRFADLSLIAFARILGQVHMSPLLARYRQHPGLQQRLGNMNRVDLTFGLHLGWAIEGAVGSDFKIDASYLSPNVSIAEGMERATQVYGVHIIASESVVTVCSKFVASKCRLIDKALVRGSKTPLDLYAFDLNPKVLQVHRRPRPHWSMRQRFKARQLLEMQKRHNWLSDEEPLFHAADEVNVMRSCFTVEFFQVFAMGYWNYNEGEWVVARRFLLRIRHLLGFEDGPSQALLAYMDLHTGGQDCDAPDTWQGVRDRSW